MNVHRRPKSQVLFVLGLMFASAATLRAGLSATAVMASQIDTQTDHQDCPAFDGPAALVEALIAREAKASEHEQRLNEREEELSAAREALVAQLEELQAAEESLKQTLTIADRGAETELAQLTSVYEQMKPDDAARLFSQMDPDFAAGFLGRMSPQAAAGIMAGLDPETAYLMSVVLAGQNASASPP